MAAVRVVVPGGKVVIALMKVVLAGLEGQTPKAPGGPLPPTVVLATESGPETSFCRAQIRFTIENVRKSPTTKAGSPSFGADLGITATWQISFGSP